MEIVSQTNDELVIKDNQIILAWFIVPIFLIGGIALYAEMGPIYSSLFVVSSLLVLFGSGRFRITINKSSGEFIIKKIRLIGSKTKRIEIRDIAKIEVRKSWIKPMTGYGQRGSISTNPVLIMKNGKEVSVTYGSATRIKDVASIKLNDVGIYRKIANFINVPIEE